MKYSTHIYGARSILLTLVIQMTNPKDSPDFSSSAITKFTFVIFN